MPGNNPNLEIEIILPSGEVKKSIQDITKESKKASAKIEKDMTGSFNNVAKKGVGSVRTELVAIAGLALAAFGSAKVISAANQQEDAINDLNTALKLSGEFTQSASLDFQDFASTLQQNSRVGDEVILQNAALIQNLGKLSTDALKPATKAALDMSEALGISLTSAATLVGKAAAGEIGSFSRYGVIIQKGSTQAETFANTLATLEKQFGGAAKGKIDTYAGAWEQMINTFGDAQEEVGFLITKTPEAVLAIKEINKFWKAFADYVINNGPALRRTLGGIIDSFVIEPAKFWKDFFFGGGGKGIKELSAELVKVDASIDKIQKELRENKDNTIFNSFLGRKGQLQEELAKELEERTKIQDQINEFNAQQNLKDEEINQKKRDKELVDLRAFEQLKQQIKFLGKTQDQILEIQEQEELALLDEARKQRALASEEDYQARRTQIVKKYTEQRNKVEQNGVNVSAQLMSGFVNLTSRSMQYIGQSLINGSASFEGFLGVVVNAMGDMAISMGTTIIAADKAMQGLKASLVGAGGAGIIYGAALVAVGAAMKAFGSTFSGAGGGPASGGNFSVSDGSGDLNTDSSYKPSDFSSPPEERQVPGTSVQLVVQGNVLNTQETADNLVSLLNNAFEERGLRVNGAIA